MRSASARGTITGATVRPRGEDMAEIVEPRRRGDAPVGEVAKDADAAQTAAPAWAGHAGPGSRTTEWRRADGRRPAGAGGAARAEPQTPRRCRDLEVGQGNLRRGGPVSAHTAALSTTEALWGTCGAAEDATHVGTFG